MSLLLLLTGYPQGGQGTPPTPEPTPTVTADIEAGPGRAPRGVLTRRGIRVGQMIADANRIEEDEIFIILT